MDGLISRAGKRDVQRLRRLDVDHANPWISALPSTVNDKDTVMEPRVYLTCIRRLLGLPVFLFSCSLPSMHANYGYIWRSRLMLQEVGGYDLETQSGERSYL